jgi:heat-inducible transcriptional repressor
MLVKVLDGCMSAGTTVTLGSDSSVKDLEGLSFVAAPYSAGDGLTGSIAVIGPMWMDYSRIIPLVDYTAGLFGSELLSDRKIN